jgi:flagellar secretion chaperone FliS
MLPRNPYARAYHQAATQTASPGKLTLMLFDGAMRFIDAALAGFEDADYMRSHERVHNNVAKVQAILTELQATLNLAAGGECAQNLYRLYDFLQEQLRRANVKKEPEPLQIVQRLLGDIRSAWSEMLSQKEGTGATERLAIAC